MSTFQKLSYPMTFQTGPFGRFTVDNRAQHAVYEVFEMLHRKERPPEKLSREYTLDFLQTTLSWRTFVRRRVIRCNSLNRAVYEYLADRGIFCDKSNEAKSHHLAARIVCEIWQGDEFQREKLHALDNFHRITSSSLSGCFRDAITKLVEVSKSIAPIRLGPSQIDWRGPFQRKMKTALGTASPLKVPAQVPPIAYDGPLTLVSCHDPTPQSTLEKSSPSDSFSDHQLPDTATGIQSSDLNHLVKPSSTALHDAEFQGTSSNIQNASINEVLKLPKSASNIPSLSKPPNIRPSHPKTHQLSPSDAHSVRPQRLDVNITSANTTSHDKSVSENMIKLSSGSKICHDPLSLSVPPSLLVPKTAFTTAFAKTGPDIQLLFTYHTMQHWRDVIEFPYSVTASPFIRSVSRLNPLMLGFWHVGDFWQDANLSMPQYRVLRIGRTFNSFGQPLRYRCVDATS